MTPILLWHRRDLRLTDNPAMHWAAGQGRPVIPVFLLDEVVADWGAASKWRIGRSLEAHAERLEGIGSRLILRRGPAAEALSTLLDETGAGDVVWSRLYVHDERARDEAVLAMLERRGADAHVFDGHIVFRPEDVATGSGGFYKVYTPFYRNVAARDPEPPLPPVEQLPAPDTWPPSDALADWNLGGAMNRGGAVLERHARVGELAARARLVEFVEGRIRAYAEARDKLPEDGTSKLGENLTYGEISARECLAAVRAEAPAGAGRDTFAKELLWRDFAHHLAWHTPKLTKGNWKPEWDAFPWRGDNDAAEVWRRGITGVPVVDAAMREMYVTGTMHNRGRLLTASYLTKHMLTHWRVGCDWFADALTDWDPANNALNWQWVGGCGPDASPFFRIFNPETQAERFDRGGRYRGHWLAERADAPSEEALAWFEAIPRRWGQSPDQPYPEAPVVGMAEGRARALEAMQEFRDR
ncbi:deoxyribodipyrimidine photo-lyase [Jannaschia sp. W003]|uniref:cryptochrome/photolyase family protein n=1 Tax=Jannaschia sp. W003 TaxID=2867012 RepID=UPI0021A493A6|nr:deoxyribodipyrimidine photo-lyase [Jannaschia sp. W003]UWQ20311.1 DNA photolyase family protein [Jannaschia sp. W003]